MLNNIVDSDLFLVYKGIIPSNIPSIDLSVSSKYYFNYKSGEIILRINSDFITTESVIVIQAIFWALQAWCISNHLHYKGWNIPIVIEEIQ